MRKSLTIAALAAAALPVLLTGCQAEVTTADGSKATISDNGSAGATSPPAAEAGAKGRDGTGTGSGQARSAKTDASGARTAGRVCSSIKARVTFPQQQTALVTITNTGSRACSVKGWPWLRFTNAANESLPLRATRKAVPGVPQRIEVPAGAKVYASFKWRPCDKADTRCNVATGMRVFAPGSSRQVDASMPGAAAAGSLTIAKGSLAAGILTRTEGEALMWEDDGA